MQKTYHPRPAAYEPYHSKEQRALWSAYIAALRQHQLPMPARQYFSSPVLAQQMADYIATKTGIAMEVDELGWLL